MLKLLRRIVPIVIPVLVLLSCVSVARGVYKTTQHSWDFRWHPERLFIQHIDPWQDYLDGDPHHALWQGQIPNDLPLTYILLLPLGLLPYSTAKLVWAITNVLLSFTASGLIAAHMRLTARRSALLLCAFFLSTCFRWGMDNGQQCFLVLFLIALTYCSRFGTPERPSGIALAISYFKYSFSPPFFFDLLWRRLWKTAAVSLIPLVAGLLLSYFWLGSSISHLLTAPAIAANRSYPASVLSADLMLYLQLAADRLALSPAEARVLVDGLPLLLCFLLTGMAARDRRISPDARTGLLCVFTVVLFRHLPYDYVLLLFPAAYAVKHIRTLAARIFLLCLCWFGFGTQFALRFSPNGELGFWWVVLCSGVLFTALLAFWVACRLEQSLPTKAIRPRTTLSTLHVS